MKKRAFLAAFPLTLPVMAGYLFLGMGFGVLLAKAGFGVGWAFVMSGTIYAGAMQYVAVDMLATQAALAECALMTLVVNARHLLYGLSMAPRYAPAGKLKPYLAFSLTDETFAMLSLTPAPEGVDPHWFDFFVSALHQSYWILGGVLGALAGALLPFDLSGIAFSMPALFVVMAVEQWRHRPARLPLLLGLLAALLCLILLGPDRFTVPAMLLIVGLMLLGRGRLDVKKEGA